MKRELIIEICIALIALLFGYTAISKFIEYDKFVFQMQLAPLPLMKTVGPALGIVVPGIELIIAISLLFEKARLKALYGSLILFTAFDLYIGGMLLSGKSLPCTCGGIISKMGWQQHLLFNLLFILITITAIILLRKNQRAIVKTLAA